MIRKSAKRFSGKIMLKQQPKARRRFFLISSRFKALAVEREQ
jgi:hypothetical protein